MLIVRKDDQKMMMWKRQPASQMEASGTTLFFPLAQRVLSPSQWSSRHPDRWRRRRRRRRWRRPRRYQPRLRSEEK